MNHLLSSPAPSSVGGKIALGAVSAAAVVGGVLGVANLAIYIEKKIKRRKEGKEEKRRKEGKDVKRRKEGKDVKQETAKPYTRRQHRTLARLHKAAVGIDYIYAASMAGSALKNGVTINTVGDNLIAGVVIGAPVCFAAIHAYMAGEHSVAEKYAPDEDIKEE